MNDKFLKNHFLALNKNYKEMKWFFLSILDYIHIHEINYQFITLQWFGIAMQSLEFIKYISSVLGLRGSEVVISDALNMFLE